MVVSVNARDGGGGEGEYDQSCANKSGRGKTGRILIEAELERKRRPSRDFLSRLNCCKARSGHKFTAAAHKRASGWASDRAFLIRRNLRAQMRKRRTTHVW